MQVPGRAGLGVNVTACLQPHAGPWFQHTVILEQSVWLWAGWAALWWMEFTTPSCGTGNINLMLLSEQSWMEMTACWQKEVVCNDIQESLGYLRQKGRWENDGRYGYSPYFFTSLMSPLLLYQRVWMGMLPLEGLLSNSVMRHENKLPAWS